MNSPQQITTPLIGDPARQAPDLYKGLVYQIWRSVEAWINLSDGELLFLEGAEDYDVVSKGTGTAVQVKATTSNITLRSEAVISALNSFWLIKNNHNDKQIWLHFITTSAIGSEQGNPFANGVKGLEAWTKCVKNKDLIIAEQLRQFLITDTVVAPQLNPQGTNQAPAPIPTLLEFLQTADAMAVLDEFITHISWKTESEDSDVVRENVAMNLRAHGENLRLRPTECDPAKDHLFRIVAETAAKKKGRILSKDEFRREFEQATLKSFSPSEITTFTANANLLQRMVSPSLTSDADVILAAATLVQIGIPSLSPDFIKRTILIDKVSDISSRLGGIVIKGSSGMGKSTLAKLAAKAIGGQWIWADFQGVDSENVPQMIKLFAKNFIQSQNIYNLALDNLDFNVSDLTRLDVTLAAVVRSVRSRGGKFLVTTQRDLPGRLLQQMSLTSEEVLKIPYFREDEIKEFCQILGCPNDKLSTLLAKIVLAQTSGHPQLVHARLVGLSANSWPQPEAEDIIAQPPEIVEERDVARQLLDDAPIEDKELLYRLSITTNSFRKDHVLAIAQIEPTLQFGGDSFTRLVGPWIEVAGGKYYRLSPLLNHAAVRTWPADKILTLRAKIAHAFLSCGKKTLLEANEILLQGLLTGDEIATFSVAVALGKASLDANSQIADSLSWLMAFGREKGKKIFPKNAFINFLLRLLQFRIVAERSPDEVEWLCEAIDSEIPIENKLSKVSTRMMWLSQALISTQAMIAPETLISYWAEAIDLFQKDEVYKTMGPKLANNVNRVKGMPKLDFPGMLFTMVLTRKGNLKYVFGLIKAIGELPQAKKDIVFHYAKKIPFILRNTIDRAWMQESRKKEPNWIEVLSDLDAIKKIANDREFSEVAAFAYRATAIIEDEYLNQPERALEAIDVGIALASSQTYIIEDQKAIILDHQKKYLEALSIWKRILPNWPIQPKSPDILPLFACQRAGSLAGQIQDWPLSKSFFEYGQRTSKVLGAKLEELTFLADEAFVHWKMGERAVALSMLTQVTRRLEILKVDDEDDFQFHRAWKSIEQVIKWCRKDSGEIDKLDTFEPPVGFCSKSEANEKIKDIPKSPIDFLWLFLAETELQLGTSRKIFDSAMNRVSSSNNAPFRSLMLRLNLSVLFRNLDFTSLVEAILMWGKALSDTLLNLAPASSPPNQISVVEETLLSALVVISASNVPLDTFLPQWSKAIGKISNNAELNTIVARIKQTIAADKSGMLTLCQNKSNSRLVQMIAALRMATDTQERLEIMLYGQVMLLTGLQKNGYENLVSEAIGKIVKQTWEQRLNFAAEFPTPRIVIPAIKTACEEQEKGFKLAARILLQARFAAPSLRLPAEIIQEIQTLAH